MHGVCEFWEGCALGAVAFLAHTWAQAYPFVTGTIALCSLFLAVHGVFRIVWRWWHGLPNFLTDREYEDRHD